MKLTIIVPVFNEEKTILTVIDKICHVKLPCLPTGRSVQKEIIVVDDGSSDATASEIKNLKLKIKNRKAIKIPPRFKKATKTPGRCPEDSFQVEELSITLLRHLNNQGKGAAIRTGIKQATGDYILIQDADLEYDPAEIPKLLSPILNSKALKTPRTVARRVYPERNSSEVEKLDKCPVAVYGSRFLNNQAVIPTLYLLGNKLLTFLTNLLYGTKLTDMETGYKLLPASFLKKADLTGNRFEIEPEITIKLVKNNIPIIEVPISYKGRTHFAGKKLTVKDAWGAIKMLIYGKFFS